MIILKDKHYALVMELHYKIYEAYDLMERFVVLKNESTEVMQIEKLHSGQFHVPYEGLNFRMYTAIGAQNSRNSCRKSIMEKSFSKIEEEFPATITILISFWIRMPQRQPEMCTLAHFV